MKDKDADKLAIVLVVSALINVVMSLIVQKAIVQSVTCPYLVFWVISVVFGVTWPLMLLVCHIKKTTLWVGIPIINFLVSSILFAVFAGIASTSFSYAVAGSAFIASVAPICGVVAERNIDTGKATYEYVGAGIYFVCMTISQAAFLLS